jgi:phage recombination protein Bet
MSEALTTYQTDHGEIRLSPSIVKKYLVSGDLTKVSEQEVMMFLALCKYQKLNPFLREAYLIKFGTESATIVTGKEVFTKRAAKRKECAGWDAGIVVIDESGNMQYRNGTMKLPKDILVGGWAKVHRHDYKTTIDAEVTLEEYCRTNREGKPMAQWAKMPSTMIRKVALVQALREAFPEDFLGMYSPEEMPVDTTTLSEKPIETPFTVIENDQEQAG